jgi:3-oxocholest-4-en-26-oyl-CoA dehydrogenase alpha subunit
VDFTAVTIEGELREFWLSVRELIDTHITEETHERAYRTGDGYDERFYRALGERGWLMPNWPVDLGGAGLDAMHCHILERELAPLAEILMGRGLSALVSIAIRANADPTVRQEILPKIARGEVQICLGYSEPDGGSDLAATRTRAVRDGDEWVINGSKMWTTNAQNSQYTFLLARTNADVPKHRGLTTFLIPLDSAGVEIRPILTLGGERTNVVYYADVRIPDRLRVGPVDTGWQVVHGPLDAEHGFGREKNEGGFAEINGQGAASVRSLETALRAAYEWSLTPRSDGSRPIDDPIVQSRLGAVTVDVESARGAPGIYGRVIASENLIRSSRELVDLLAPESLISRGGDGAIEDGVIEYTHRHAQTTAIYGGTVEIFRNMIAHRGLGMPR